MRSLHAFVLGCAVCAATSACGLVVSEEDGRTLGEAPVRELTWTMLDIAGPPDRFRVAQVDGGGRLLLFGGAYAGQTGVMPGDMFYDDTWSFDGSWQELRVDAAPPARHAAAMAYDESRGVAVLFGGATASTMFGDTWELAGSTWAQQPLAEAPPARGNAGMVYDSLRERVVLFGGRAEDVLYADTWQYDGAEWTLINTESSPPPRSHLGMAYDSARDRIVLFGGCGMLPCYQPYLSDTWEFDGREWVEMQPATVPSWRYDPGLTYDAQRERIVMYGGRDETEAASDTLEYDGVNWMTLDPKASPPPAVPKLTYTSSLGLSVMYFAKITWLYGYQ